jgi:3-phytase
MEIARCGRAAWLALLLSAGCYGPNSDTPIKPVIATDPVAEDPDDPAIWIHPSDPDRSLILGTNKTPAPGGALVVFGLDGKTRQTIAGIDRPNNVDVEYGLTVGGEPADIAVLTERLKRRLRVFRIAPDGSGLADIGAAGGPPVFDGEAGEQGAPMGVALYRRPGDGAIFAIVGRKEGPKQGYLWQYRLEDDGAGRVKATKVREFGAFSGAGEIEAIAVDDPLGFVYYADEGDGIHKWHADPDHPDAAGELAHFGKEGFREDREGIAIYARPDGTGYIICTDQLDNSSRYLIFRREGAPGNPHDHQELLKAVSGGADSTDGIEVTSTGLGPPFPKGLLIAMNASGRNFLVYRWEDVAAAGSVKLP